MHWSVFSWITSFSSTLIVVLVCFFLFRQYRERFLGIWTGAWAAYALRFVFEMIFGGIPSPAFLLLLQTSLLFSGLLIIWGTYAFLARPLPKAWLWASIATEAWAVFSAFSYFPFEWVMAPAFVLQACIVCWTGIVFLTSKNLAGIGKYLAGWALILAGLHGINYPFTVRNENLAPWGFLFANILTFCISVGFLLVFFQRVRTELKDTETRSRAVFENSAFGVFEAAPDGEILGANSAFVRLFGFSSAEDALRFDLRQELHLTPEVLRAVAERPGIHTYEAIYRRKNGGVFAGVLRIQFIANILSGFIEDVTQRKRVEEELRKAERRFRDMLDTVRLLAMTLDAQGRVTYCNPYLLELTGRSAKETLGNDWFALFTPPETQDARREDFFRGVRDGHVPNYHESEIVIRNGERRLVAWNNTVFRDAKNQITGTADLGEDITERKRMERDLRESEERYRTLFETMLPGVILQDETGNIISANPAAERILEIPLDRMREIPPFSLFQDAIHEDGSPFPPGTQAPSMAIRTGETIRDSVMGIPVPGGDTHRWIVLSAVVIRGDGGLSTRIFTTFEDITEQKRLTSQLIQAQKMETVGRLAGGIAHDFNNLLTIINGNAEMALLVLPPENPIRESIHDISTAAERAAVLTRRLLAFSRRMDAEPSLVNFNTLLLDMNRVLRRLIRENIEIVSLPGENLWTVRIDPVQFEQILVNLVVNSRDAMTEGGKITIETGNTVLDEDFVLANPGATAGEFVLLSVRDTGTGMDAKTLARIFEPFFTTKEVSGGSGLGLATCMSIVKQYGGYIQALSTPGKGTVMNVYFPRVPEPAAPETPGERGQETLTGTETMLVVEDEPDVRSLTVRALTEQGYTVLEADYGEEAIRIAEQKKSEIDLLITDIIMPRMGGKELAERLRKQLPGLKVIFMSGYVPDPAVRTGIIKTGDGFLQKPFTPTILLRHIRRILDATTTPDQ